MLPHVRDRNPAVNLCKTFKHFSQANNHASKDFLNPDNL
jgi:hypothetical protein